ncbi:MAG: 2-amino-4-hydroxy-6-hydroxymethyldihydropteridine diphosphokinase, partial [Nitrococcus mobilis]|nr:2-amino-4-hydroxy-6-hydroxymethyldihydropteridine diphosphokinase [Nitrococcus mobilis]
MKRAYVSIGSNIDRETNVRSAIAQLRRRYGHLIISPIYESAAVGFVGAAFYNGVIGLRTSVVDALTLNAELRAIERVHGRRRNAAKFCSRSLDLDLLIWGDAVM